MAELTISEPARLSSNDSRVLSALFDPESSPSAAVRVTSSSNSLPNVPESDIEALQAAEKAAISSLEGEAASKTSVLDTVSALSKLISEQPNYASAYANRAQARRLLIGPDIFSPANTRWAGEIFSDLARAVALASPQSPQDGVSSLQAKVLATAHTHRGYLLLRAAKEAESGHLDGGPEELRKLSKDQLEEMAAHEFVLGGRYGDKVARQLAVGMNPYAKMCGAIVKEALKEEMKGGVTDDKIQLQ